MKKFLAFCLSVLIIHSASAQTGRGQFMLGGNLNYSSRTTEVPGGDDFTVNTFSLSPNAGYFIVQKLALGGRLSSSITKVNGGTNEKHVVSPFLRYYVLNPFGKANFFVDAAYSTGTYKSGTVKRSIQGYGFMGGPVIFVRESVGLEFTVSYLADKMEGGYWNKSIVAGVGLQVHLGSPKFSKPKKSKKDKNEDEDDEWWW
jgi:hypothetical protein